MFEWIWKEEGDLVQESRVSQQDETRKEESTV